MKFIIFDLHNDWASKTRLTVFGLAVALGLTPSFKILGVHSYIVAV